MFRLFIWKGKIKTKIVIAVYRSDLCQMVVWYVPLSLFKALLKFLLLPNLILTSQVTGKRVNRGSGYGLNIRVNYTSTRLGKAVAWI